jgi:Protein kinase domain
VEAGASELALGSVVGPYRIEALLGEGGMGKVFRAMRTGATEPVALKVMRNRLSGDEESRRRFLREARAAGEVRHAHLVPVLDAGEAGGRRYLVMPYVRGRSLDARIRADGPLPILRSPASSRPCERCPAPCARHPRRHPWKRSPRSCALVPPDRLLRGSCRCAGLDGWLSQTVQFCRGDRRLTSQR